MPQVDRAAGYVGEWAYKAPCRVATTANITLSGEQTIDGVAVVTGNRVLVKDQITTSENGIRVCDTGEWARAKDFDGARDVVNGTQVAVNEGTVSAGFVYSVSATDPVVVGTDAIAFAAGYGGANGASGIAYTPAGTGAVSTTIQTKLRETVSVKDFGADSTGTSDSYTAFLNAINYLISLGGGTLFVPRGSYLLLTSLVVSTSEISITGEGFSSIILNGTTNTAAIQIGNSGSTISCFHNSVSNLTFAAASGVTSVAGGVGLLFYGASQGRISNLSFTSYPNPLYSGLVLDNTSQTKINEISIQNSIASGFVIQNNSFDIYCSNSRSDANGSNGIVLQNCSGLYFSSVTCYGNAQSAWVMVENGFPINNNCFFINCIGDTSGSYNWLIAQLKNATFVSCWGSTQLSQSVNTFATGFIISGGASGSSNLTFTNCIALYNNSHGFSVYSSETIPDSISFIGCQSGNLANPNGLSTAVVGNGINVSFCTNLLISNCRLRYNGTSGGSGGGYGISLSANVSASDIIDNNCTGNQTGAISDSSSNAVIRNNRGYSPTSPGNVTAGTSPWTSTPYNFDCMVMLTAQNGQTGFAVNGQAVNSATTYIPYLLKAGKVITSTWATTAPTFNFSANQ